MAGGQFVNAGEPLAAAGEPEMQAGNNVFATATHAVTERPDVGIAAGDFDIIFRAFAVNRESPDVGVATAATDRSPVDVAPPGDIPQNQTRDVWMFQTTDDGQVYPLDGDLVRTDGFETALYLTWFGGNQGDDGSPSNRAAWWGNVDVQEPAQAMVSRYQFLAESSPLTSANLIRLRDAALQDAQWLIDLGLTIDIDVRIEGVDRLALQVTVNNESFLFN